VNVTERTLRLGARPLYPHAARDELRGAHLEVEAQLGLHVLEHLRSRAPRKAKERAGTTRSRHRFHTLCVGRDYSLDSVGSSRRHATTGVTSASLPNLEAAVSSLQLNRAAAGPDRSPHVLLIEPADQLDLEIGAPLAVLHFQSTRAVADRVAWQLCIAR